MKIKQMTSIKGNKIPNQFIIQEDINEISGNCIETFQSYESIIAKRDKFRAGIATRQVWLDEKYWNYSKTTGKYRNLFLGEDKKTTERKIKEGTYILTDLNKG